MYDITAERKSLYTDLELLQHYGLDVVMIKGKTNLYFVGKRDFEVPELKLLVDAVQSSKFITHKKSNELFYYNVDLIHMAIRENKQIGFTYFDYDVHLKKHIRNNGARYSLT